MSRNLPAVSFASGSGMAMAGKFAASRFAIDRRTFPGSRLKQNQIRPPKGGRFVKKAISEPKKSRGRPATGHDPSATARFPKKTLAQIVAWAARQKDHPSRAEAIRRLVELGLKKK
jgi:hypothetical protein